MIICELVAFCPPVLQALRRDNAVTREVATEIALLRALHIAPKTPLELILATVAKPGPSDTNCIEHIRDLHPAEAHAMCILFASTDITDNLLAAGVRSRVRRDRLVHLERMNAGNEKDDRQRREFSHCAGSVGDF
jgi:hypothetical protein